MPENTDYMILGYVLGFGILLVTIGSIWLRARSLDKDEAVLRNLEEEQ